MKLPYFEKMRAMLSAKRSTTVLREYGSRSEGAGKLLAPLFEQLVDGK